MGIIILIAIGAVVCVWIGYRLSIRMCVDKIRKANGLPSELTWYMTVKDAQDRALEIQQFLRQHKYCKAVGDAWTLKKGIEESLNKAETEILYSGYTPSYFLTALVGLCDKLGVEIVLKRKDTGEERAY